MKKQLLKFFLLTLLLFNIVACDKIKSKLNQSKGPESVVIKYFDNLITYDDSKPDSKDKIDKIINNYLDVNKLQENSIRLAAEYAKSIGKSVSDEELETAISHYKALDKDFKETTIKLGLQTSSKAFKNKLAGRPFAVDIKGIKYSNNNNIANVNYVVRTNLKTDNEVLTDEHAILEKIDNKWKIISYTLPDSLPNNNTPSLKPQNLNKMNK